MLEDYQRAAMMPNAANMMWAHFVQARYVDHARADSLAVDLIRIVPQSQEHASVNGMLEYGAGDALPVVYEFDGTLDLMSREVTIRHRLGDTEKCFAGRFSENGRVLTLRSCTSGRDSSKQRHLVHEATRLELFGS